MLVIVERLGVLGRSVEDAEGVALRLLAATGAKLVTADGRVAIWPVG